MSSPEVRRGVKRRFLLTLLMTGTVLLLTGQGRAGVQGMTPLRLSPAPPQNAEECELHDGQPAQASARESREGDKSAGRGAGTGRRPAGESEHRPQPMRTYYFGEHRRLAKVEAFVRRPDGSVIEPELQLGVNPKLSFPTPFGDGPNHGANNVYLVEKGVEDNVLVVRAAQWLTMHHSCGWGHEHKFDPSRTQPQAINTLPIEIVIEELWDTNFHAKVTSGQQLQITVLNYGQPLPGARVIVRSENKWIKEVFTDKDGTASLQLIRDYYPAKWTDFKRSRRGEFLVTALYEAEEAGVYENQPYGGLSYMTTLPWKYSPARADYSSYALGLIIVLLGVSSTGGGVYFYRERRKKPYRGISLEG